MPSVGQVPDRTPIAFLVSAFPQLSQTFIYREFESLWRRGQRFVVIATDRTDLDDRFFSDELAHIRRHTLFVDFRNPAMYRGLLSRTLSRRGRDALAWMARLPHRSTRHRVRAMAAAALAAHLEPELRARGV